MAIPVLLGKQQVGENVVVIGGGDVGCELACDLSRKGKKVTIVEMMDRIMARGGSFVANEQNLRYLVDHSGIDIRCGARLSEILPDRVKAVINDEVCEIPCDSVVFAAGYRASHKLYDEITDAGFECVQIGDNVRPGKIIDAISQGYNCIRVLD